jgi:hypothetical protein
MRCVSTRTEKRHGRGRTERCDNQVQTAAMRMETEGADGTRREGAKQIRVLCYHPFLWLSDLSSQFSGTCPGGCKHCALSYLGNMSKSLFPASQKVTRKLPGIMVHTCNPSTQEAETGGS